MLAFIFSILIFFICFSVGFSILPKSQFPNDRHLFLLLSPILGLGLLVVIINFVSRLGFSVKDFSWPLMGIVVVSALVTVLKILRNFEFRKLLGYLFIIPPLTLFGAWPILKFGFHWFSFMNDDMNTYVLGATRFSKPSQSLFLGTDYSQAYYHFYVKNGVRPGSELLLSFLSNFHHGNSIQIFMPTIVALQMVLVAATVALVRVSLGTNLWKTVVAYVLTTILPLVNLGFLSQLIAQVGGLSFSIAIVVLFTKYAKNPQALDRKNLVILLGILISALLLFYPEIAPLVGLPLIILCLFLRQKIRNGLMIVSLNAILISLIFLNKYFIQAVHFSVVQIGGTVNINSSNKLKLFPYFLKPQGLAALTGLSPLNKSYGQLILSFSVLASITFLLLLVITPFFKPREVLPFQIIFLVMIVVLSYLILSSNGFGAYKMAMYIQPFLICMVILSVSKIKKNIAFRKFGPWISAIPSLLLSVTIFSFLAITSQFYVSASTGIANKGFVQIPEVSSSNLVEQISSAERSYKSNYGPIFSVSPSLSQIHLEASVSRGIPLLFLSRDPIARLKSPNPITVMPTSRQIAGFVLSDQTNKFGQLKILSTKTNFNRWFLLSNDRFSSLNKTTYSNSGMSWNYKLVKNPPDYLVFINSSQAPIYDDEYGLLNQAALFPSEPNPMIPGSFTQSIGDSLLIQILDFHPGSYLRFNLSSTVLRQYFRRIPEITVIGSNRVEIKPIGSGSARVLAIHVIPLRINNQDYLTIKFDQKLKVSSKTNSFIDRLYGSQISIDYRRISTLLSDLSLVIPPASSANNSPSRVGSFPEDLENPLLNYSGAYEDGWMSPSFYFDLKSTGSNIVNISGFVPLVGTNKSFKSIVTPYVDGVAAKNFTLGIGNFNQDIRSKVKLVPGTVSRVEFRFRDAQILPEPDGRPASIFLTNLGFK
jgi:hypothetical protein